MQYVTSVERFAIDKGREEGRREEAIRLLLRLLTHRFGEVSETVQTRLRAFTLEQTEALVDTALTSQSLTEFAEYLPVTDKMASSE